MSSFECPVCHEPVAVPDNLRGNSARCQRCGGLITIANSRPVAAPSDNIGLADAHKSDDEVTLHGEIPDVPKRAGFAFLEPPRLPDEIGRLGNYRILRVVGSGEIGVVFEAEDLSKRQPVALKIIRPDVTEDDDLRQRILKEAQTLTTLNNEHIVRLHKVGEVKTTVYLAMDFLAGESLDRKLERDKILPVPEVVRLCREIATGLVAAHRQGLIHRDIKPTNIWLEGNGNAHWQRLKLLDFGIVRPVASLGAVQKPGLISGSPIYTAPEQVQAEGAEVDARADLFNLGLVLYRACTGDMAFQGDDPMSMFSAMLSKEPRTPASVNPAVPPGLSQLIMHMLAKERDQRPASAKEVLAALQGAESSKPAPRQSPPPQKAVLPAKAPAKAPRKHTRRSSGFVLIVAALLLAIGIVTLAIIIRNQRRGGPAHDVWLKQVAVLKPEERLAAVNARLRALNPGFEGVQQHHVENNAVTQLALASDKITDLSPLQALRGLKDLNCNAGPSKSALANLAPLRGLGLTHLRIAGTRVTDLTPLVGMPLSHLELNNTPVRDLDPLRNLPLTWLGIQDTEIADLSSLKGMPLVVLDCSRTKVTDLTPIKSLPLEWLRCEDLNSDLAPLAGTSLKAIRCTPRSAGDWEVLRGLTGLTHINGKPAAVFWAKRAKP